MDCEDHNRGCTLPVYGKNRILLHAQHHGLPSLLFRFPGIARSSRALWGRCSKAAVLMLGALN